MGDHRALLPELTVPTLVVQTSQDMFVPDAVGRYIASQVQHGTLRQLAATGHYPQLSAPDELVMVLREWAAH